MRRLTKGNPPSILQKNRAKWTAAYAQSGGKSKPWRHSEIKKALLEETGYRCAYCEAGMLHVSKGDIEHILPREHFPELVVEWSNLTIACSLCNGNKGSKYVASLQFVNPYVDQIETHLIFTGPVVAGISPRGDYTVRELNLNSEARVAARFKAIGHLESNIRKYEAADEKLRAYLKPVIDQIIEDSEYGAAVRNYAVLRRWSFS